jgi:hypothetical protein
MTELNRYTVSLELEVLSEKEPDAFMSQVLMNKDTLGKEVKTHKFYVRLLPSES